jgi:hypothetical protein
MVVGLIHLISGFFIYGSGWSDIVARGIIGGVGDFDQTATAFWFGVGGPFVMIIGGLVDHFESTGARPPSWLGWAMAALLAFLILPMPLTGAWLLVPPTIALLRRKRNRQVLPN